VLNGRPKATAFSMHSHQPLSGGTVVCPGARRLNEFKARSMMQKTLHGVARLSRRAFDFFFSRQADKKPLPDGRGSMGNRCSHVAFVSEYPSTLPFTGCDSTQWATQPSRAKGLAIMKRVDFISPGARLEDALSQLEQAWQATREHWNDPISQKVEDDFLVPLHGQIRSMLDAISKMAITMRKAEQECLHPRERSVSL
jgi:hypothetical protein